MSHLIEDPINNTPRTKVNARRLVFPKTQTVNEIPEVARLHIELYRDWYGLAWAQKRE
jgi:hypothetical protein